MTIPTSVDETMAPRGGHVAHLFTQYTPYHLKDGRQWDDSTKKQYAEHGECSVHMMPPDFDSMQTLLLSSLRYRRKLLPRIQTQHCRIRGPSTTRVGASLRFDWRSKNRVAVSPLSGLLHTRPFRTSSTVQCLWINFITRVLCSALAIIELRLMVSICAEVEHIPVRQALEI